MIKRMTDFKIFFGGKLHQIGKDLATEIQNDFDEYPELGLTVRSVEIKGFSVRISINREAPHVYYADEDSLVWNDALVFTGNFKDDPDEALTIPMPEETYSCLHDYCFYINVLLKDYNHIVRPENWIHGFKTETTDKYFTIEYQF